MERRPPASPPPITRPSSGAHAAVNAEADPDKRRALKEAYFDVADKAVRRVLGKWADETARERLEKIKREAEQDAFEMAMED